jgi:hypothetical protein
MSLEDEQTLTLPRFLPPHGFTDAQKEVAQKIFTATAVAGSSVFILVDDAGSSERAEWYLSFRLATKQLVAGLWEFPSHIHRLGVPGQNDRLDRDIGYLDPPESEPDHPNGVGGQVSGLLEDKPPR